MDRIMNFVKKYMMLIVPCSIFVLAMLLFPFLLMGKKAIAEDMKGSRSIGTTVMSLRTRTPSEQQPNIERAYEDAHENDAKLVEELAKQTTQRTLISYDVFPEPTDSSHQIYTVFGENYRNAIRGLMKKLNALDGPSEVDIKNATGRLGTADTGGYGRSRRSGSTRDDASRKAVIDMLCEKRALEISVYGATSVFRWYDYWDEFEFESKRQAIEDCWNAQMSYWIYDDVVKTIRSMNAGASNVKESHVKRLIGVNFDSPVDFQTGRSRVDAADKLEYVTDSGAGLLAVMPWTTRQCDDYIDVAYFSVGVVLKARSVPLFIKELCSEKTHEFKGLNGDEDIQEFKHNQITVLKYSQRAIDRTDEVHENYRYGEDALVRLDMICEYVFDRSGYDKIKPKSIKSFLGQLDENENEDE